MKKTMKCLIMVLIISLGIGGACFAEEEKEEKWGNHYPEIDCDNIICEIADHKGKYKYTTDGHRVVCTGWGHELIERKVHSFGGSGSICSCGKPEFENADGTVGKSFKHTKSGKDICNEINDYGTCKSKMKYLYNNQAHWAWCQSGHYIDASKGGHDFDKNGVCKCGYVDATKKKEDPCKKGHVFDVNEEHGENGFECINCDYYCDEEETPENYDLNSYTYITKNGIVNEEEHMLYCINSKHNHRDWRKIFDHEDEDKNGICDEKSCSYPCMKGHTWNETKTYECNTCGYIDEDKKEKQEEFDNHTHDYDQTTGNCTYNGCTRHAHTKANEKGECACGEIVDKNKAAQWELNNHTHTYNQTTGNCTYKGCTRHAHTKANEKGECACGEVVDQNKKAQYEQKKREEANKKATGYIDVDADRWTVQSIKFVTEKGIMEGAGNDTFVPAGQVTREQLAAIIGELKADFGIKDKSVDYTDKAKFAVWSSWGIGHYGAYIVGENKKTFNPTAKLTEKDVMLTMVRMLELDGKIQISGPTEAKFKNLVAQEKKAGKEFVQVEVSDKAIKIAIELGILEVPANYTHGIDEAITREELAVGIYRLYNKKDKINEVMKKAEAAEKAAAEKAAAEKAAAEKAAAEKAAAEQKAANKKATGWIDIGANRWSLKPLKFVSEKKIMSGISADEFDPRGNVTKEQLAVIISRIAEDSAKTGIVKNGIVEGKLNYNGNIADWSKEAVLKYGGHIPGEVINGTVSRKGVALAIVNALDLDGKVEVSQATEEVFAKVLQLENKALVNESDEVKEAIKIVIELKIMTVDSNGNFRCNDSLAREEMAQLIYNIYNIDYEITEKPLDVDGEKCVQNGCTGTLKYDWTKERMVIKCSKCNFFSVKEHEYNNSDYCVNCNRNRDTGDLKAEIEQLKNEEVIITTVVKKCYNDECNGTITFKIDETYHQAVCSEGCKFDKTKHDWINKYTIICPECNYNKETGKVEVGTSTQVGIDTKNLCPYCDSATKYVSTKTLHVKVCVMDKTHILSIEDHTLDANNSCTVCGTNGKLEMGLNFVDFNSPNHYAYNWAYKNVASLVEKGIVNGTTVNGEKYLYPKMDITAEAVVALLSRSLGYEVDTTAQSGLYSFIPGNRWSQNEWNYLINELRSKPGNPIKIFLSDKNAPSDEELKNNYIQPIKRGKVAYIMSIFLDENKDLSKNKREFEDLGSGVTVDVKNAIEKLSGYNILRGDDRNHNDKLEARPNDYITRAEAITLFDRFFAVREAMK